ncbi:MAG: YraN family protein [Spirochaetales bacterium]|nr:YraN family protein [Spirochaetales bacterium]MCF7937433.1 YraN family protein [Spirochaetales bacterium]
MTPKASAANNVPQSGAAYSLKEGKSNFTDYRSTSSKGQVGEEFAAGYLRSIGHKIIERNFRTRTGEVDIVSRVGSLLVFVEVKNWDAYSFDSMEFALHSRKRRRIVEAARRFLYQHAEYMDMQVRFDLVYCSADHNNVEHIEDAFEG